MCMHVCASSSRACNNQTLGQIRTRDAFNRPIAGPNVYARMYVQAEAELVYPDTSEAYGGCKYWGGLWSMTKVFKSTFYDL